MRLEVNGNGCLPCFISKTMGMEIDKDKFYELCATEGIEVIIDKNSRFNSILSYGVRWKALALKIKETI